MMWPYCVIDTTKWQLRGSGPFPSHFQNLIKCFFWYKCWTELRTRTLNTSWPNVIAQWASSDLIFGNFHGASVIAWAAPSIQQHSISFRNFILIFWINYFPMNKTELFCERNSSPKLTIYYVLGHFFRSKGVQCSYFVVCSNKIFARPDAHRRALPVESEAFERQ